MISLAPLEDLVSKLLSGPTMTIQGPGQSTPQTTVPKDRDLLTATLYSEAKAKDPKDMSAVGSTVWNRMQATGKNALAVISGKNQYSGVSPSNQKFMSVLKGTADDHETLQMAHSTADAILSGSFKPTHPYKYYTAQGGKNVYRTGPRGNVSTGDPEELRQQFSRPAPQFTTQAK